MVKIKDILTQRLAIKEKKNKITALAEQSAEGNLTSFAGIFGKVPLNEKEKAALASLLHKYSLLERDESFFSADLEALIFVTSEVKAINNQAAILHGERIKKAQEILKKYREGAFSAWLITTYGNRQTPYNFLQYYDFYKSMPHYLQPLIETIPRQAIYTLASRQGPLEKKEELIRSYQGETKEDLLRMIRLQFPIPEEDGRREKTSEKIISILRKVVFSMKKTSLKFNSKQKSQLKLLIGEIERFIDEA